MRAHEILAESPIPDDWDQNLYAEKSSFKNRLAYARERAKRLGAGSSRVAFEIDYKGRPTVLKLAMNKRGIAQISEESTILGDGYIQTMKKTIPIIDYDDVRYTWIHTELAQKVNEQQLCRYFNVRSLVQLVGLEEKYSNSPINRNRAQAAFNQITRNFTDDQLEHLEDWVGFFHTLRVDFNVELTDCKAVDNWGMYQGRPVLIDLGYTSSVKSI